MKTVVIAADHAGFELKEQLKKQASLLGISFIDLGTNSVESVDYPDFAQALAKKLVEIGPDQNMGVLICGSGVGVSIAVNRFPKIRAVLAESEEVAKLAREHNHANVLCLGARIVSTAQAVLILKAFINTEEDPGPRHLRRIQKLGESTSS